MTQNWKDLCVVDGEKPSVASRNEGKHTGRNDLLFIFHNSVQLRVGFIRAGDWICCVCCVPVLM